LQVLVGPNASGKTTFLDVVSFLGDVVSGGVEKALSERSQNPRDLFWARKPAQLGLAVEAEIPVDLRHQLRKPFDTIRYELAVTADPKTLELAITRERVVLKVASAVVPKQREMFPERIEPPDALWRDRKSGSQAVLTKVPDGNVNFYSEVYGESGKGWFPAFKLGPHRSTLGNLPADETKFPVSSWLRSLLQEGVQRITLNSLLLRKASPPGGSRVFRPDGSNLPWVVNDLKTRHEARYRGWLDHLRTALPDIEGIRVVIREDDRHAYLVLQYVGGLEAPSWVVSDGTLRLLALTVLAYIPGFQRVYLVEEPENGIHPTAVQTVFESLGSVYDGQVLLASHSPVLLAAARSSQLLCFARDSEGATDIVRGDQHPALRKWRGEVSLGSYFASGILG
jgi:predicted ATPase